MGQFAAAGGTSSRIVLSIPDEPLALAEALAGVGQDAAAGELFRGLAKDAVCPTALLPAIAAGLGQIGEFGAALGACLELTRRHPEHAEAHFGAAYYLRRLGRPTEEILPVVERAHDLAPDVTLYRTSLAMLLDHVGRREEARDLLRRLDLDTVSCRGCLGRITLIFREDGPFRPRPSNRPGD